MAFLTPRETVALAALIEHGPTSGIELSHVLTAKLGTAVTAGEAESLARSLVGQDMAERLPGEVYQATREGRAWLS